MTSDSDLGQSENALRLVDRIVHVRDDGELELIGTQSFAVKSNIGNVKPIAAQERCSFWTI